MRAIGLPAVFAVVLGLSSSPSRAAPGELFAEPSLPVEFIALNRGDEDVFGADAAASPLSYPPAETEKLFIPKDQSRLPLDESRQLFEQNANTEESRPPDTLPKDQSRLSMEPDLHKNQSRLPMEPQPEGPSSSADASSPPERNVETLSREEFCTRLVASAQDQQLPVGLFSNLIWQESRFQPQSVSRAGAQGVAQFMPKVAAAVGLHNPFNPLEALPAAARFLRSLFEHFGNFGLATAAYNAGPMRVSHWLSKRGKLPAETRNYVRSVTGRPAEDWRDGRPQDHVFRLARQIPCPRVGVLAEIGDAPPPEPLSVIIIRRAPQNKKSAMQGRQGRQLASATRGRPTQPKVVVAVRKEGKTIRIASGGKANAASRKVAKPIHVAGKPGSDSRKTSNPVRVASAARSAHHHTR